MLLSKVVAALVLPLDDSTARLLTWLHVLIISDVD